MSLADNIAALATRIATEFKAIRLEIAGVSGGGGSQQVFTQQTRPAQPGPWVWYETDADGKIIDLTVNDGA